MTAPTCTITVPLIDRAQAAQGDEYVVVYPANGPQLRTVDGAVIIWKRETFTPDAVTGIVTVTLPQGSYFDPPAEFVIQVPGPNGGKFSGVVPSVARPLHLETLKNSYGWGLVQNSSAPAIQTIKAPPAIGDTFANLVNYAAAAYSGYLFWATDTNVYYRSNGTSWTPATVLDGALTDAKVASNANIAGSKIAAATFTAQGAIAKTAYYLSDYADLATALTAIGSTVATLVVHRTTTVSASLAVPSSLTLRFDNGAQVNTASGQTFTINGPIVAPDVRLFAGPGTVRLSTPSPISPSWFGVNADGVSDNANPLANLSAALTTSGFVPHIRFPSGTIYSSASWNIATTVNVRGAGWGFTSTLFGTKFLFAAGVSGILVSAGVQASHFADFSIYSQSTGAGSDCGFVPLSGRMTLENVHINNFGSHGFNFDTTSAGNCNLTSLHRCRAGNNRGDGFHLAGSNSQHIQLYSCEAVSNVGWGYSLVNGAHNQLYSPMADANAAGAYSLNGAASILIQGAYTESSATSAISVVNSNYFTYIGNLYAEPTTFTIDAASLPTANILQKAFWQTTIRGNTGPAATSNLLQMFGSDSAGRTYNRFFVTNAGDVTLSTLGAATAPTVALAAGGSLASGVARVYMCTFSLNSSRTKENGTGSSSTTLTPTGGNLTISLTKIPVGPGAYTWTNLYVSTDGGATWTLLQQFNQSSSPITAFTDDGTVTPTGTQYAVNNSWGTFSLGPHVLAPASNATNSGQLDLSIGAAGMRFGTNGNPLSFFGVSPASRQTGDLGSGLTTLGLFSGTPTFSAANLTGTVPLGTLPAGIALLANASNAFTGLMTINPGGAGTALTLTGGSATALTAASTGGIGVNASSVQSFAGEFSQSGTLTAATGVQGVLIQRNGVTNQASGFVYSGALMALNDNPTERGMGSTGALLQIQSAGKNRFFVTNAGGVTLSALGAPTTAPTAALTTGGTLAIGTARQYAVTYANGTLETTIGTASGAVTPTSGNQTVTLTGLPLGPGGFTTRNIYISTDGGSTWLKVGSVTGLTATFTDDGTVTPSGTPPTVDSTFGTLLLGSLSIAPHANGGVKHGTATSQLQSWWGATPIAQPSGDVLAAMTSAGLMTTAGAYYDATKLSGLVPLASLAGFTGAAHAWTHAPGGTDDTYAHFGHLSSTAEYTFPQYAVSTANQLTAGQTTLSYFTAREGSAATTGITVSGITVFNNSAYSGTPTLVKFALYSVDGSGNLTLVASTASDTTLFNATSSAWTRAFVGGSVALTRGQRYAIAVICVGGTTPPKLWGTGVSITSIFSAPVRVSSGHSGDTDIPASITAGSLSNLAYQFYAYVS